MDSSGIGAGFICQDNVNREGFMYMLYIYTRCRRFLCLFVLQWLCRDNMRSGKVKTRLRYKMCMVRRVNGGGENVVGYIVACGFGDGRLSYLRKD